jgi:phosphatidate cytidylyltransferase
MSNLGRRIVVAGIGLPVVSVILYAGDLPLALFLATVAAVGASELFRLARTQGVVPFETIGVVLAAAMPMVVHLVKLGWIDAPLAAAGVLFVALVGIAVPGRAPDQKPLEAVAVTVFGVLYCGGTVAFGYALRHHRWAVGATAGTALVLYPLVLTWGTDIAAFCFGRWLGVRKLMPSVSPGKTVAGAVGGTVTAVALALIYNSSVLRPLAQLALAPWTAAVFGLVVAVAAQVGDLAESLFKREAGVKDSSNLLPGHGGMLDRLDSLYVVLPVSFLILGRLLLPVPAG